MLGIISLGGICHDTRSLRRIIPRDYYAVAADSGLAHFRLLGIKTDMLVGDMDSISTDDLARYKKENLPIELFDSRKNSTDSEIALDKAVSNGCDSFLFIGAFGNRLDHMLSNQMMAVSIAMSGKPVILTDGITFFHTISQYNSPFKYEITNLVNNVDVISVIPVIGDAVDVTIEGLEYKLDKETILFGSTRAVSNTIPVIETMDAVYATIMIESGMIFFIHTKSDEFLKEKCDEYSTKT